MAGLGDVFPIASEPPPGRSVASTPDATDQAPAPPASVSEFGSPETVVFEGVIAALTLRDVALSDL
ncbi:hypothetical protein [Agromyces albus]|uniref:Uncharacterized protein n=1 Tax=Agromyces albus TaxID=205332 RepID=A0A4Q2KT79_9MICO|nr:hypothetical protein [Agromyces albus]RXZ66893.1 hypothetical protein ESP51_20090 [Agromyces albus]